MKRRFISSMLATGVIFSSFAGLAVTANAAAGTYTSTLQPGETVKFDFGTKGQTAADGYVSVTPDMYYFADGAMYGFLGISADSYNEDGNHDGFSVVKGQYSVLGSGGTDSSSDAASDYISVPKAADYKPEGASAYEGRYPIRFAMKVDEGSYYTVKVTLANASASENTDAVLMSEKCRIIDNNISIAPGETKEYTFSVDVESVYKKSPKTNYTDEMLNIELAGKNAAIAAMEVTRSATTSGKIQGTAATVNSGTTMWLCTDSTGCDQGDTTPYFPLQVFSGVGQELPKYAPLGLAISNQGEGGLASNDNMHLAMCKLKEGDYLYVEYGHNESSSDSYKENLENYYSMAQRSGATLIIVSAVERHNNFDTGTNEYTSGFTGYINAAKEFVDEKIVSDGAAAKIAFVDLNTKFIEWMNTETTRINGINSAISRKTAIEFYYRSAKGSSIDISHINDAGADQAAYRFFLAAQDVYDAGKDAAEGTNARIQSDAVKAIVTGWHSDRTPYVIPDEVINAGAAPNEYWDAAVTSTIPYKNNMAVADVDDISDGTLSSVTARVMNAQSMLEYYGRVVVKVTSAGETTTYYSTENLDNTAVDAGTVKTFTDFNTDPAVHNTETSNGITVPDGASVSVRIYAAEVDTDWTVKNDTPYSAEYTVKNVTETVFTDSSSGWSMSGGSGHTETYNEDGGYWNLYNSGSGSYVLYKSVSDIAGGVINVRAKLRLNSGDIGLNIANTKRRNENWFDNYIPLLIISGGKATANGTAVITDTDETNNVNTGEWVDIDCIVDLDKGEERISVAGSDYTTVSIPALQTNTTALLPLKYIGFTQGGFDADVKDLTVTKIKRTETLDSVTVSAAVNNASFGSVKIDGEAAASKSVEKGSSVTFTAVPEEGYYLAAWTDADGGTLSTDAAYTVSRVVADYSVRAVFESIYGEGYTVSKITGLSEDFEGDTNIFGESNIFDTSTVDENSIFGKVLKIPYNASNNKSALLDEAVTLDSKQFAEISMNTFYTYSAANKNIEISVQDGSGNSLASFKYNGNSCNITEVKIGGTTPADFVAFGFSSATVWQQTDKYNQFNYTSLTGTRAPGIVTIRIMGDKNVTLTFTKETTTHTYTGTLSGDVNIKSINISSGASGTSGREFGLDNIKTVIVTSPYEHHSYTINAVDENGAVIKTLAAGNADETRAYSVSALAEVITDSSGRCYRLRDGQISNYTASYTMGTADEVQSIVYETNENIAVYKEAESLSNTENFTGTSYSGGSAAAVTARKKAEIATLAAGSYKAYVSIIGNSGRGIYLRDSSVSDNTSNVIANADSNGYMEFTLAKETTVQLSGYTNTSDNNQANRSADFDYIIIEKIETLQDIVDASGGTITGEVDGDGETASIANGSEITISGTLTNATLQAAESGTITVKVGDSTISGASSVQFDSTGKVIPSDGAVMVTQYKNDKGETVSDNGYFKAKSFETAVNEITFSVTNKENKTAELKKTGITIEGDVIFGLFITGVPEDETLTVTVE